ncbi:NADPH-dependent FMN reductase [Rhizobium sp. LEGMi135b]
MNSDNSRARRDIASSRLKVAIVVGNPKPQSRTRAIAEKLVEKLLPNDTFDLEVVELAEYAERLFAWSAADVTAIVERVASSSLVIFASPTYKATYTGLLKAFLDRYSAKGLTGVVAIPLMTGGDQSHSMGSTFTLAPLLLELGASLPLQGLYFAVQQMHRLDDFLAEAEARFTEAMDAHRPIIAVRKASVDKNGGTHDEHN